jgi:hypothetical protein
MKVTIWLPIALFILGALSLLKGCTGFPDEECLSPDATKSVWCKDL